MPQAQWPLQLQDRRSARRAGMREPENLSGEGRGRPGPDSARLTRPGRNNVMSAKRDYSLTGRDTQTAIDKGLAAAEWYHTDVPRKQMKELMKRSDGPAIRDTAIWLAALVLSAAG